MQQKIPKWQKIRLGIFYLKAYPLFLTRKISALPGFLISDDSAILELSKTKRRKREGLYMERMDCLYGTVSSSCRKGIFIITDDGDSVFSYYGWLKEGTRVLCTVQRKAKESLLARVSVDAVMEDHISAA